MLRPSGPGGDPAPARRRAGPLLALAVPAAWALLGVYACHSALPYNPVELPFEKQIAVRSWLPQGWCFFTKDPRDDRMLVFRASGDGSLTPAIDSQTRWPRRAGGFDRRLRAVWIEAGLLFVAVSPNEWSECKEHPARCLEAMEPQRTMVNTSPEPHLCGRVGLVRQRVLPWAWARARSRLEMPSKVLLLEVACSG